LIRLFFTFVETSYLNIDMSKFESSPKEENTALSPDSLKAYSKPILWP